MELCKTNQAVAVGPNVPTPQTPTQTQPMRCDGPVEHARKARQRHVPCYKMSCVLLCLRQARNKNVLLSEHGFQILEARGYYTAWILPLISSNLDVVVDSVKLTSFDYITYAT